MNCLMIECYDLTNHISHLFKVTFDAYNQCCLHFGGEIQEKRFYWS